MSEQPLNSPETVEEEWDLILDLFTLMSHAGFAAFVIENLAGVSLMPKDILPGATEALLVWLSANTVRSRREIYLLKQSLRKKQ